MWGKVQTFMIRTSATENFLFFNEHFKLQIVTENQSSPHGTVGAQKEMPRNSVVPTLTRKKCHETQLCPPWRAILCLVAQDCFFQYAVKNVTTQWVVLPHVFVVSGSINRGSVSLCRSIFQTAHSGCSLLYILDSSPIVFSLKTLS